MGFRGDEALLWSRTGAGVDSVEEVGFVSGGGQEPEDCARDSAAAAGLWAKGGGEEKEMEEGGLGGDYAERNLCGAVPGYDLRVEVMD